MSLKNTRNFCIIAHIDHGKSTLSDRMIEMCTGKKIPDRVLDRLDLERERGITIKAQAVRLEYKAKSGETYTLNLIDTPGHVDFSYEVSRSMAVCEGAILLIDASQGVQAQTVANCYAAEEQGLEFIVALNKIDVAHADTDAVKVQIEEVIGIDASNALRISGRDGTGVRELIEQVVEKIPAPSGSLTAPLRCLIADSWFDPYEGVVSLVRVVEGEAEVGSRIGLVSRQTEHRIESAWVYSPQKVPVSKLEAGMVVAITCGVKNLSGAPVGETITTLPIDVAPIPGFKEVKPNVYACLFPVQGEDFEAFRKALTKLRLNDSAVTAEPESSDVLGFGFRCGFLGTLHMEVVMQRLESEFQMDLLVTAPMVAYEVVTTSGKTDLISNPSQFPEKQKIAEIREPIADVRLMMPADCVGKVMQLITGRRGRLMGQIFSGSQAVLEARIPMAELIVDFFDRIKSISQGYASYNYDLVGYEAAALEKLDILINGQRVDSLSCIIHRNDVTQRAKDITLRLKESIPRQMFEIPIQAAIGGRILARENVRAMRKNVTAKCYGGDITRKKKLLQKQKAGKRKMKMFGKVEMPSHVFREILSTRND